MSKKSTAAAAATVETAAPEAAPEPATPLGSLTVRLEALAAEALELGEERVAKFVNRAVRSARHADKLNRARRKRVGTLVERLKAQGLSDAEIVAQLSK
jgi:hypothetical protein